MVQQYEDHVLLYKDDTLGFARFFYSKKGTNKRVRENREICWIKVLAYLESYFSHYLTKEYN